MPRTRLSPGFRPTALGLLAATALFPLAAAEAAPPAPEDLVANLERLGLPGALVLAGLGVVLLFFGWRLVVLAVIVGCGLAAGLAGLYLGTEYFGRTVGWILAGTGLVLGVLVGGGVHRLSRAAGMAMLLGSLGAAAGTLFETPHLAVALAVAAGIIGFLLGWVYARHIEAIATAVTGAQLLALAAFVLVGSAVDGTVRLTIATIVFVLAVIPGLAFQLRSVRRHEGKVE